MRETCDFRIVEEFAGMLFRESEGRKLGSGLVRKVAMATSDPRFERIGELQRRINQEYDRSFFHGWNITRSYSQNELQSAPLLRLIVTSVFEPAGEERGTRYNESTECPRCRSGGKQVSDLYLDWKRIPKGKD